MIFKVILIIAVLGLAAVTATAYSDSYELNEPEIDCDSLYEVTVDSLISSMLKNEIQFDYDRRNDNFDSCFEFMSKYFHLLDEFNMKKEKRAASKNKALKEKLLSYKY